MTRGRLSIPTGSARRCIARTLLLSALLLCPALVPAAKAQTTLPIVKVVATGGTIANTPDGRVAVETIIDAIPQILEIADLRIEDVTRVGSSSLTFQEFIDTAKAIERTLAQEPEVDAFVVTVGSNASEDLAWFLNLVIRTDKPIVVTAAQRQRTTLSEDASRNFLDAVRVAASPTTAGQGVVLVVNELIHSAREVTKAVVSRVDSWLSPDLGVLGMVSGTQAVFYRGPLRRHTTGSEFDLDGIEIADDLPQVEILYSHVGASPALIDAAIADGAQGLVIAGYLTGTPHARQSSALAAAAENGIAVVLSTRGSSGRVDSGSGAFVGADTLTPQKAHILLMMALSVTKDPAEIRRIFEEY